MMEKFTLTFKPRNFKIKLSPEELQEHLKLKRGNGTHQDKTKYSRKRKVEY